MAILRDVDPQQYLYSFLGSFRGRGKEPGTHCLRMHSIKDLKTTCFNVGVSWMTYGRVEGFGETSQRSQWLAYSCRLWRAPVLAKHAAATLRPTAAKQQWSSRIRDHLGVQVWLDNGLPQHVCPKCKRELQTVEGAAEDSGEQRQRGCCLCQASC